MSEKGVSGKGVGARIRRKEDQRHLHGKGQFVADIKIPGTLEAAFVRSQYAHGIVRSIEIPEEYKDQVFTAKSFPTLKNIVAVSSIAGFKHSEHPALATDRVRFAGEAIAIVVARTRAEAEDIADQVEVEIEELPAVVDTIAATLPDAPLIYDDWGDNLYVQKESLFGDIESAKRMADVVIQREYKMNRQSAVP